MYPLVLIDQIICENSDSQFLNWMLKLVSKIILIIQEQLINTVKEQLGTECLFVALLQHEFKSVDRPYCGLDTVHIEVLYISLVLRSENRNNLHKIFERRSSVRQASKSATQVVRSGPNSKNPPKIRCKKIGQSTGHTLRQQTVSVSSTFKDFQTVYEGDI